MHKKDLITWKLQQDNFEDIDTSKVYYIHLSDIIDFKNTSYNIPINYQKIIFPHKYKFLKNEELLLAQSKFYTFLNDSFFVPTLNPYVFSLFTKQLFKVYSTFKKYKIKNIHLIDLMLNKRLNSIEGIINLSENNNESIFHRCSLIYLICLTDCYKLF